MLYKRNSQNEYASAKSRTYSYLHMYLAPFFKSHSERHCSKSIIFTVKKVQRITFKRVIGSLFTRYQEVRFNSPDKNVLCSRVGSLELFGPFNNMAKDVC